MNLENMEILTLQRPRIGACGFLSVNVESTNREVSSGLARKNTVNDARYLRDGWKTIRPATMVEHRAGLTTNAKDLRHGY